MRKIMKSSWKQAFVAIGLVSMLVVGFFVFVAPTAQVAPVAQGQVNIGSGAERGIATAIFSPAQARGQLLKCGVPDPEHPEAAVTPCELCHLVELIRDIVVLLVEIAGSVAILNLIIAGLLYVAGPSLHTTSINLEQAKKTLTYTVGGFILVGLSWAIIMTAANIAGYTKAGSLFQIDCQVFVQLQE